MATDQSGSFNLGQSAFSAEEIAKLSQSNEVIGSDTQREPLRTSRTSADAPKFDGTTSGRQSGGQFLDNTGTAHNFVRQGDDVFEIMGDGSRRHISSFEFQDVWEGMGLNLEVLPKDKTAQTIQGTTGGPVGSAVSDDLRAASIAASTSPGTGLPPGVNIGIEGTGFTQAGASVQAGRDFFRSFDPNNPSTRQSIPVNVNGEELLVFNDGRVTKARSGFGSRIIREDDPVYVAARSQAAQIYARDIIGTAGPQAGQQVQIPEGFTREGAFTRAGGVFFETYDPSDPTTRQSVTVNINGEDFLVFNDGRVTRAKSGFGPRVIRQDDPIYVQARSQAAQQFAAGAVQEATREAGSLVTLSDGTVVARPPQNLALSQSGEYYRIGNDVYRALDNKKLTEREFVKLGLNFDFIKQQTGQEDTGPTVSGEEPSGEDIGPSTTPPPATTATESEVNDYVDEKVSQAEDDATNPENFPEIDPGNDSNYNIDYSGDDPELIAAKDTLIDDLEDLEGRDPLGNETVSGIRRRATEDLRLNDLRARRVETQARIDTILGAFEILNDEIEDDPGFSQALKKRRFEFLDKKEQRQLAGLQRELSNLTTQITDAEKQVNERVQDTLSQYNIYADKRDFIQKRIDKIDDELDENADNIRAAYALMIQNPELAKNATPAEMDYIDKNGTFPKSLIKKLGDNAGLDIKSLLTFDTGVGESTIYAVTNDGEVVELDTVPNIDAGKVSGGGDGDASPDTLRARIQQASDLARAIQRGINPTTGESLNLSDEQKTQYISDIGVQLEAEFIGDSTAVGSIRNHWKLNFGIDRDSPPGFAIDVANELASAASQRTKKGKRESAQRSVNRLTDKYPGQSEQILKKFNEFLILN